VPFPSGASPATKRSRKSRRGYQQTVRDIAVMSSAREGSMRDRGRLARIKRFRLASACASISLAAFPADSAGGVTRRSAGKTEAS